MRQTRPLRVLFLAVSYAPTWLPSDKRFLNALIGSLPDAIAPAVWTLTESTPGYREARVGAKTVPVVSQCRIGHRPICDEGELLKPHPRHSSIRQAVEIAASVSYHSLASLSQAVRSHQPHVIHLYDNIGPITRLLKMRFPDVRLTCSKSQARTRDSRYWWLYAAFLRATYNPVDSIVAYTGACRTVLADAGIPETKLSTVPWGIEIPAATPSASQASRAVRRRYGCSDDELLVVVLPRGSESYILHSIELANSLSEQVGARFVFAIRPTLFSDRYLRPNRPGVWVERGPSDFHDLLAAADVALAPVQKQQSTALPPLAWIEAMARGTPVITMANPGAEECVVHGGTGLLYTHESELTRLVQQACDRRLLTRLSGNARDLVVRRFSVETAANQYAALWDSLVA